MKLCAGVDAGQSSTSAIVGDDRGTVLGTATAGPGDEVFQDAESTRLRDAVRDALHGALNSAGLHSASFESVVIGLSGYEGRVYGCPPELATRHLRIVHDSVIAHAGAFEGGRGVTVISGTGSAAYASDGRAGLLVGGWGYLFGDGGSAFGLVRSAVEAAMIADDIGVVSRLAARLLAHFEVRSVRALARSFYSGELSRAALANGAPAVLQAARDGDDEASLLVERAASDLVRLAVTAARRLPGVPVPVAFVGGMMADASYAVRVAAGVAGTPLQPQSPKRDPLHGALLLAFQDAGIAAP